MGQILKRAHDELFRRTEDESFATMQELWQHCYDSRQNTEMLWHRPQDMAAVPWEGRLELAVTPADTRRLNSWSFGQLCQLSGVSRDTVNRLSPETASKVFEETMPRSDKPLQVYAEGQQVRSIHGASYTRLHNVDLLTMLREFATDFTPPQESGASDTKGASGLYCGEQDMFCFLIDPTGWTEINGEAFAPGFFVWNSEVGKRSVGVQTFWFQAVCRNHIVWDAIEVVEFSRKHTANVHDSLGQIRTIVERLVEKRDERRDGFAAVIKKAMTERLGDDADEVMKVLTRHGVTRHSSARKLFSSPASRERSRSSRWSTPSPASRVGFGMRVIARRLTRRRHRCSHSRSSDSPLVGRICAPPNLPSILCTPPTRLTDPPHHSNLGEPVRRPRPAAALSPIALSLRSAGRATADRVPSRRPLGPGICKRNDPGSRSRSKHQDRVESSSNQHDQAAAPYTRHQKQMPSEPQQVMTIDELSAYLKVAKSTLYKLAQDGKVPGQKVGKHWRFSKDAIDRWLQQEERADTK